MNSRMRGLPIIVLIDAESKEGRAVNGLHIQTFVATPYAGRVGTLITFASGDTVTVEEDFDTVVDAFMADRQDG